MKVVAFADVHSNRAALEAVVGATGALSADATVCLGDVVGYGPEPSECISAIRALDVEVVQGNHDRDAVSGVAPAPGTRASARIAQDWTRAQLREEERLWLAELPNRWMAGERLVAVHGCYLNRSHITGYVTGTMLEANLMALGELGYPPVGLCGHTHIPCCAWLEPDGTVREVLASGEVRWPADAVAVLINPGSVGQPRDGDVRAAYAVIDLDRRSVRFERVPYPVRTTVEAIARVGLPPELGLRLEEGR